MRPVLSIEDLSLGIRGEDGLTPILDKVSLEVERGQVQGLAGESGSGKTITGLTVIGLEPPKAEVSGHIWMGGEDLLQIKGSSLNAIRGARVGMVFQDPSTSLHPQLTVGAQLTDHVRFHLKVSRSKAADQAVEALDRVGVTGGRATLDRYPHEFSGGQRQRIAIARALAAEPSLLIADEPISSLDASTQARVAGIMCQLAAEEDVALLFISHDLSIVRLIADRLLVMVEGEIVEEGLTDQIWGAPQHPYTRRLLASIPKPDGLGILPDG